ncbi:MAG: hypothetical protein GX316_06435 [Firmicutes bacterium]|nr:hypothetical protein [Bacillota bacterium]
MSVQRKAHELANALAASPEYARLQAAQEEIEERQAAKIMLQDARKKEMLLREKHASGEDISESELADLQKTVELVSFNPYIRELMEAEYALSEMLMEIWAVITEAVGIEQSDEAGLGSDESSPESAPEKTKSRLWVPGRDT